MSLKQKLFTSFLFGIAVVLSVRVLWPCRPWQLCFWMKTCLMDHVCVLGPSSSNTGKWRTVAECAGTRRPRYTHTQTLIIKHTNLSVSYFHVSLPQLKFMWGNLAVGSGERWREVAVPTLQPGQVGVVSVALCAPTLEGTYTSHWRLAHRGEQFGPRVWCSIVVDPNAPTAICADGLLVSPCVTPHVRQSRD